MPAWLKEEFARIVNSECFVRVLVSRMTLQDATGKRLIYISKWQTDFAILRFHFSEI